MIVTVMVIAVPVSIVMPLTILAVVPGVIGLVAAFALLVQLVAALLRLRTARTVVTNGVGEPGLGLFDAVLALGAVLVHGSAGRGRGECGNSNEQRPSESRRRKPI